MSFEKKIRRHTAKEENPKNDNQRVAGCLCNARKIDHLMFPKSPIYSGANAAFTRRSPLEKSEPAQYSAGRQDPERIEPRPEHQYHCSSDDRYTLPTDSGGTSHHITAGNDEPDRQRSKPTPHDALPWHVAEAVPQPVGKIIHRAGRPEGRERTGDRPRNSSDLQPEETHHQDHVGSGHHLRDRKEICELLVGHPALGDGEIMNIRQNRREPAKADRRQHSEVRCQYQSRGRAVHRALALSKPATAMLTGANASSTIGRGSLVNAMPAKAKPAKSNAARRLRCGINSRSPVPISSPAAEAESPLRMFCRTAISVFRITMPPIVNPTVQGTRIKPATALIAPIAPRSLAPTQTVIPTMFGPGISWQRVRVSANSCSSIHCCCSTTARRAQTSPPPNPLSETLRKPMNRSLSGTRSPEPLPSGLSIMASPRRLWPIGSASGADTSRLVRYRAGSIVTNTGAALERLREHAVKSASIARACCGRWPVERRCRAGLGARRRTRSHGYRAEGYNFYPAGRSQSR